MSFILKIGVNHMFLNILEVYGNFLDNEKNVGIDMSKHYLISMNSYIPSDNDNFSYETVENFVINLIVFRHHFKLK